MYKEPDATIAINIIGLRTMSYPQPFPHVLPDPISGPSSPVSVLVSRVSSLNKHRKKTKR